MNVITVKNDQAVGEKVGSLFVEAVAKNPNIILGLATGSSPISTYQNIIKTSKDKNVDWTNVKTFNLDEYKGLEPTHKKSYRYFMNENLFDHININKENTHVPSGAITSNEEAAKYDAAIAAAGGIDIQLLGLGINGHVGFNEPGTSFDSITSIVDLTESTIEANSRFFQSKDEVPTQAISMGLKSIMNAKKVVLIAMGKNKAEAVKHLVEGPVSTEWPCTTLLNHNDVTVVIDEEAASLLTK
jgi:glucosamine-6-phosphate deaminase